MRNRDEEKEFQKNRQEVTEQISKKEGEIERLESTNRLIHSTIDTLKHELTKGYQELSWINDDERRNGGGFSKASQYDEEQAHRFQYYMQISEEEVNQEYHKEKKRLENERDALYKRRVDQTWD